MATLEVPLIGGEATDAALGTDSLIDADQISQQLVKLRDTLAPVVTEGGSGGLALDTLEVQLGITVGGKVGFIAKGSVDIAGSITLTFKRGS